ncbi:hypothetical protein [Phytohabitans kaempferiae]|uniref:Methyltransferase n=1 Tax=Phytohabitans kaempferiae TaxID=1620943 RepID=A0ABV6MGP5_9ACTN
MLRNRDADWDAWPVQDYLAENYRRLHRADEAVIDHHSAVYARLDPDSLDRTVEFGAGPNLYPLALAAAASRLVHAVEPSAASVAYLRGQLAEGPDDTWDPFYARCRLRNPALPPSLVQALSRVRVTRADALTLPPGRYALASMNFVAESATEDRAEFAAFCQAFVRAVRPGGHLVASFMENMGRYSIAGGREWPGVPVDSERVGEVFAPYTVDLEVRRIDADPDLPEWGYTGMVLMSARRAG